MYSGKQTSGFLAKAGFGLAMFGLIAAAGCSGSGNSGAPEITAASRSEMASELQTLGARITAEADDATYLTLRSAHVEIRDSGGTIQSSGRTRKDLSDFLLVTYTMSKHFLDTKDSAELASWLKEWKTREVVATERREFSGLNVSLSRRPPMILFSRRAENSSVERAS